MDRYDHQEVLHFVGVKSPDEQDLPSSVGESPHHGHKHHGPAAGRQHTPPTHQTQSCPRDDPILNHRQQSSSLPAVDLFQYAATCLPPTCTKHPVSIMTEVVYSPDVHEATGEAQHFNLD